MPPSDIVERVERLVRARAISWVKTKGGYSSAGRYRVKFDDSSSAFVKWGTDELTAGWLRDEYRIYSTLRADFIPALIEWEDAEHPILILEDLAGGHWPPPWSASQIEHVFDLLENVRSTQMPDEFPVLTRLGEGFNGWETIAEDPSGFLGLGIVSDTWLAHALPILLKAETEAQLEGGSLVHTDVRSDNICLLSDRTLLVDWNWAKRGNPMLDVVIWLPSLHVEGGPEPWSFDIQEPELIAAVTGFYAAHAYQPANFPGAEPIRQLQLRLLKSLLPWASRALDLPEPDLF